jgi:hypothetical protein
MAFLKDTAFLQPETRQHSLGHSSSSMTLNVYSHLIPESGADTLNRFDALISGNIAQFPLSVKADKTRK